MDDQSKAIERMENAIKYAEDNLEVAKRNLEIVKADKKPENAVTVFCKLAEKHGFKISNMGGRWIPTFSDSEMKIKLPGAHREWATALFRACDEFCNKVDPKSYPVFREGTPGGEIWITNITI